MVRAVRDGTALMYDEDVRLEAELDAAATDVCCTAFTRRAANPRLRDPALPAPRGKLLLSEMRGFGAECVGTVLFNPSDRYDNPRRNPVSSIAYSWAGVRSGLDVGPARGREDVTAASKRPAAPSIP